MMKIFLHSPARFAVGITVAVLLPALILWGRLYEFGSLYIISFAIAFVSFILIHLTLKKILDFPGEGGSGYVLSGSLFWYVAAVFILLFFRLPYSLSYLTSTFILSILFYYIDYFFRLEYNKPVMAYLPFGHARHIDSIQGVTWIKLKKNLPPGKHIKAIVVDLHSPDVSKHWQKFLADSTLKGIPVYNVRQVEESLTGRVKIRHMYENDLGSLLPSSIYMLIKQFTDILIVFLTFPLTLPIMLLTAIAIKLEDGGKIFFIQTRIGHRGKIFNIYKFRSMRETNPNLTGNATAVGDARITKVGKFIRKVRIDELPQLFNVIKCEMSLIGPRPEWKTLVDQYEKKIPFYGYRHIVRPGISGWAQVMYGYNVGAAEAQIKVEYDFYYIKHYSFTLDMWIFFKTIKTILTGFGAR